MLSNELSKRDNAQKTSDEFVQFYDIAFLEERKYDEFRMKNDKNSIFQTK